MMLFVSVRGLRTLANASRSRGALLRAPLAAARAAAAAGGPGPAGGRSLLARQQQQGQPPAERGAAARLPSKRQQPLVQATATKNAGQHEDEEAGGGDGDSAPALEESPYRRGQSIMAKVLMFGPLGASVSVDDGAAFGLVLQSEIALLRDKRGSDIVVGETVPAFVEKVREDNRLNVAFRPPVMPRMQDTAAQVLEALEGSPSMTIPIGDKSSPEDISAYFYGVTKSDFKKAVGLLFKQGKVKPGPFVTELLPEDDERAKAAGAGAGAGAVAAPPSRSPSPSSARAATADSEAPAPFWSKVASDKPSDKSSAAATKPAATSRSVSKSAAASSSSTSTSSSASASASSTVERLNSQRGDIQKTIFVGNLPVSSCGEEKLMGVFSSRIDPGRVKSMRIALDADGKPRGFAHLEFYDVSDVDLALQQLKGLKIRDRVVRLDYADPEIRRGLLAAAVAAAPEGDGGTVADLLGRRPAAAPSANAPPLAPAAATLYLGNLSYKAGVPEITAWLEAKAGKGSVRSVRVASDPATGRKKGFAYVDFFAEDKAKLCFDTLHERELLGRPVNIDDATRRAD